MEIKEIRAKSQARRVRKVQGRKNLPGKVQDAWKQGYQKPVPALFSFHDQNKLRLDLALSTPLSLIIP